MIIENKYKIICRSCNKERFVTRRMISFIKSGKNTGGCKSCALKGNRHRDGDIVSDATKSKMSLASIGRKKSDKHRINISMGKAGKATASGENHYRWIKDRSKVIAKYQKERNNPEYKQWRKSIYVRDGNVCKMNNESCSGRLEVHHILRWSDFPDLRYDINNGIVLCHAHHPKSRRIENEMTEFFFGLIDNNN